MKPMKLVRSPFVLDSFTQLSSVESLRYTNFIHCFGNIKIKIVDKKKMIVRNNNHANLLIQH